jgi:acyl-CoA thioester hydrolase
MPFSVRIAVRTYELDALGHLNQAIYHSYAEHARTELLRTLGVPLTDVISTGVGPVLLTGTMRYLRELRAEDVVDVTAEMAFGEGKTFTIASTLTKLDGTVAAEFTGTFGLMDLTARRLVTNPRDRLAELSDDPAAFDKAAGQAG